MRKEVRQMQRAKTRRRGIRTIVAIVMAATAVTAASASYGGSVQGAPARAAYVCPPAC
jgi:hypothetical protein